MTLNQASLVSCIVRFHDFQRLEILELAALNSLGQQTHTPIELILVGQNFSEEEKAMLQSTAETLFIKGSALRTVKILSFENPERKDMRSRALNVGLQAATGDYLAFLDYDDTLVPEAYKLLIKRLEAHPECALTAGKCVVEFGIVQNGKFVVDEKIDGFSWGKNLVDLYQENFLPIHSFLLNRKLIANTDLYFDEDMDLAEDYAFLLRLSSKYPFDFGGLDTEVAQYRSYENIESSNPTMGQAALTQKQIEKKQRAEEKLTRLRKGLPARLTIAEVLNLAPKRDKIHPLRAALTERLNQFPALREKVIWLAGIFGIKPRKF